MKKIFSLRIFFWLKIIFLTSAIAPTLHGTGGSYHDDDDNDDDNDSDKITICHVPTWNPGSPKIKTLSEYYANRHLQRHRLDYVLEGGEEVCVQTGHGDYDDDDGDDDDDEPHCTTDYSSLEICDGKDNDCDGEIDEDLDQNPEICDGIDNNCNGQIDEGLDQVTCGFGPCQTTVNSCQNGQPVECVPLDVAQPEICDNIDNDCDAQVDEELGQTTCGEGACQQTVNNCEQGQTIECKALPPGDEEICDNNIDDDCDGVTETGDSDCVMLPPPSCACIENADMGVLTLNAVFFPENPIQTIVSCEDPPHGTLINTNVEQISIIVQPGGGYCGPSTGPIVKNLDDQLFEDCSEFVQLQSMCFR